VEDAVAAGVAPWLREPAAPPALPAWPTDAAPWLSPAARSLAQAALRMAEATDAATETDTSATDNTLSALETGRHGGPRRQRPACAADPRSHRRRSACALPAGRIREIDGLFNAYVDDAGVAAWTVADRAVTRDPVDGNSHGLVSLLEHLTDRPPLQVVWAQLLARDGFWAAADALLGRLGLSAEPWRAAAPAIPRSTTPAVSAAAVVSEPALPRYQADADVPVAWIGSDADLAALDADFAVALRGAHAADALAVPAWPRVSGSASIQWVAGMDVEWQPSRLRSRRAGSPPALFQLAVAAVERSRSDDEPARLTRRAVYLVDMLAVSAASLEPFLTRLFGAPAVLKLGAPLRQASCRFCVLLGWAAIAERPARARLEMGTGPGFAFQQDHSKLASVAPALHRVAMQPYLDIAALDNLEGLESLLLANGVRRACHTRRRASQRPRAAHPAWCASPRRVLRVGHDAAPAPAAPQE